MIFVEGDHDINFLCNLNKIPELKAIFDIEGNDVNIIPLQGSRLLKSIEHDFYKELPVKQFHLYDGDVTAYTDYLRNDIIGKNDKWDGVVTTRKCMEYYIPTSLIECSLGVDLSPYKDEYLTPGFSIVDTILSIKNTNTTLNGIKRQSQLDSRRKSLKAFLNKTALHGVTKDLLVDFGVYKEIEQWFLKMRDLKDKGNNLQ